ncbi:major facilitator superfamily domain-containing protein [Phialemonium atrogriseum]|uniref:Major facilitator superfamily domain-containing protein n=1 Tax=Phialemonium atrogriseum TaxID=1093897 RepID=A0AAJ0FNW2_9PEZI|nr:major facilitator superfamily domain-containing protein [Phialemonium atrogriseum]KAK1767565.1 major facilitator superfamily domain-containing protein [Phialemonium atrogriseum]
MSTRRSHAGVVPGTVHLVDVTGNPGTSKSKNGIELIPRPSDDPEDPLNWSEARKRLSVSMVVLHSMGVGLTMALQYSVLADITRDTGIATAPLVEGTGYMILLMGWGNLVWQPIAITYGRRGVYLLSALGTIPVMVWTAYSRSVGEWYAHRIILGFFAAPIECLPEVSIPDVFFAHDRGAWMSLYVFVLFGSNFISPLIAGWFAEAFGWRWTMHFGALVAAVTFVILFFFMEETMYFRKTLEGLEEVDDPEPIPAPQSVIVDGDKKKGSHQNSMDGSDAGGPSATAVFPARRPYLERLKPFTRMPGRQTNKEMFKGMFQPLPIMVQFPNVAWAGFIYGINLCWYNVLNATASPLLSAPPYNWSTGLVGCIYIGPLIGAAFGSLWAGVVADRFTLWLARRNNGVREPEQRLWPLGLSAVMSCVGLIVWGVGAEHQIHWAGLAVGLGILTFSCVAGGSVALSYNIDCFKDISGQSTTSIIVIRNTMGFVMSYGITPWYTNMGLQNCFIMAGFLSLGCTLTFLLMIWKGKALRRRSAERYWKYAESSVKHH